VKPFFILYKTTQREPDGRVTVTPASKVIGPVDIAQEPEVTEYEVVTFFVFSYIGAPVINAVDVLTTGMVPATADNV
jgi:hypothetical protein